MEAGARIGTAGTCAVAARLGEDAPCPPGGCALLQELGLGAPEGDPAECPVEVIARRSGFEPLVLTSLNELRRELERVGLALAATRAERTRDARHAKALQRWPV